MAVTKERFAQGMTARQYIDQMTMNKERFLAVLDATRIAPGDVRVLERHGATRRILAITEDWCGTALGSLPFVVKLTEGMAGIDMRIFLRDANLDIMDQYLKDGLHRSIPVYVIFDEDMKELAHFIERRPL